MSVPSLPLRHQFFLLFVPPLNLLDPLVMVVNGNAQDLLGSVLANDELIEMLL